MSKVFIILTIVFLLFSFSIYKYGNLESTHSPSNNVISGWKVWQDKNCQSCHQLYGLGGYLGPDLTNCFSQKGATYMNVFIQYGSAKMPKFDLNRKDIDNVMAFLAWVDSSGNSRVSPDSVSLLGNYLIHER